MVRIGSRMFCDLDNHFDALNRQADAVRVTDGNNVVIA